MLNNSEIVECFVFRVVSNKNVAVTLLRTSKAVIIEYISYHPRLVQIYAKGITSTISYTHFTERCLNNEDRTVSSMLAISGWLFYTIIKLPSYT